MSVETNKTMLVPSSTNDDSLTNHSNTGESYSSFRQKTMANASMHNMNFKNAYENSGNPLLYFASNIFKQIDILQNSYDIGSLQEVRGTLIQSINSFTQLSSEKGIENSEIMLARYLLCTFCDELIGTTYWGKDNNWANTSLLGHFYNETYGGEKFFHILNQLLRAPAKYIDLLELTYICLSLGFEGKYRIQNKGKMEIDAIRENLFRQIKMLQIRETKPFYGEQQSSSQKNQLIYKNSFQVLAVSILLFMTLVYGVLTFTLTSNENEVIELFDLEYAMYSKKNVKPDVKENLSSTKVVYDREPTNQPPETIVIEGLNE